jgi:hypothetical protein
MRLWTIKPIEVWERLQREKTLFVDPTHPTFQENLPFFHEAYEWMRAQMARRLPHYEGNYPWWAYDYKLDLRTYRFHTHPPNERWVRMELEIPSEKVLLSAYGAWHYVLNRWYLPYTTDEESYERELDAWEAETKAHGIDTYQNSVPFPEPWELRMRASWERIFDVDDLRETNTIQATFERLELAEVVRVTEFVSVRTKNRPYDSPAMK